MFSGPPSSSPVLVASTWLTCEETTDTLSKPRGYVFEVDPLRVGNPEPVVAMDRFAHEAVAFDRRGVADLSEDESGPFGCLYRYLCGRRRRADSTSSSGSASGSVL